jgi:hypothetical protein
MTIEKDTDARDTAILRLLLWAPLALAALWPTLWGLIVLLYAMGESGHKDWVEITLFPLGGIAAFVLFAALAWREIQIVRRHRRGASH